LDETNIREELTISVWDWRTVKRGSFLGQAVFTVEDLITDGVARTYKLFDKVTTIHHDKVFDQ
jgi:hypothetical protein